MRTRLNVEVLAPPPAPVASIVCFPFLPDLGERGMVPRQLKVPFEAATV